MNENKPLINHISAHCNESMELALSAERYPLWRRSCSEMTDMDFLRFGLLRGIGAVDSGRHFLQTTKDIHDEHIPLSSYFNALKSPRRQSMLEAIEKQSYIIHSKTLASQGIDYLDQFKELDQYTVEAADGHFIDHACHTEKGANGKVYAAGFIYSMNLRNGLLRPLCCITNGTKRHHEIPVLRHYIEKQNSDTNKLAKCIYVYDKAATDYSWWSRQSRHGNYMISMLKVNSAATFVKSISYDKSNEINTGIERYSTYEIDGIKFNRVDYRDPETQKCYSFVSTLPASINPGTIAMLYYKRWTIEKAFNNSKSNLKEKKAWSSNSNALNNQMRFTSMSYNLMRVFEEISKTHDPGLVHPSDKKYTESLKKREQATKITGGFVNPLFFYARIVRISSSTIRTVQSAILTGKSLVWVMSALMDRLIPKEAQLREH